MSSEACVSFAPDPSPGADAAPKPLRRRRGCAKCGCKKFFWNPVSAAQALSDRLGNMFSPDEVEVEASGSGVGPGGVVHAKGKARYTREKVELHSSRDALRNCACGHHWNYHP